ncbi:MAG: NAD-dependent epimerase/dehydratase family protein, partial [Acidobacteriota bacterium]
MKVLVSGASGLVGSALTASLARDGHVVTHLVRRTAGPGEVAWDPGAGQLDAAALSGAGACVHLAGENLASGRWNAALKERIRASRVSGTELICRKLAQLSPRPGVLVSASAVGYYGNRG